MSSPGPAKKQKSIVYSLTWLCHVFDLDYIPIAMSSLTSSLQLTDQQQCSSHDKPLEVYCDAITGTFPRHQQQIVDILHDKLAGITTAVQTLESQEEGGFLEQLEAARREIKAAAKQQMEQVEESERQLMRQLYQVTDDYVSTTFSLVKKDNLQPLDETRVRFVKSASVLEACRSLGSVVRYGQFKATGDKTSFDLCSAAPLSSEQVSCQLSPVADPTLVVKCVVRQVTPGRFEVRYSPPTAGPHQLRVQMGGTDILDTPLNVEIMPKRAGQTFTDLNSPRGLAITREGHLTVAEWDKHCITIIDPTNGRKIRSFGQHGSGQVQFNRPRGVAVTQDGHIIVADWWNHRLQVLTAEGALLATVGSKGSQPLQFHYPCDVAVDHIGKLFVTECGNHRVQVLNADLTYSHCFGSKGAQPGEFNHPSGITIDVDGMVFVADRSNNRVQKFTPEGKLLAVIDSKEEGGGRLNGPYGLCVDGNGILYVTERDSNTVSMFTSEGRFLGYIGDSDGSSFKSPWFIVSDQTGRLYISDDNGVVTY